VGVSGASGAAIALKVLEALRGANCPVAVVASDAGLGVLREETGVDRAALERLAGVVYADDDLGAPIASGSRPTRGMAVVPCSSSTVAKIALGLGDTLLTRVAHVHLKERRKLIVVPRETPMPTILLRHLTALSELGVVVLAPEPAYYLRPRTIDDVSCYVAGKTLDHLGIPHTLYRGWRSEVG
jgi:4-hydroxy-3-polyprenylbenzoate decarboxylase